MVNISRQQKLERWDTLPDNLKEALFSEYNADILWQVCRTQHLTEDKIKIIATLAGDVILGFIHPEDLAKEIRESLNLNPEIANSIANEIDRKIFSPVKTDLEKVYAPPSEEEILDLRAKTEEKSQEPAVKVELPKVEPVPKIITPEEEIKPQEVQPPEIKRQYGEVEPPKTEAEPFIIHKEAEFKPLSETKKSLGGLFGFLRRGGEEKLQKVESVKAEVKIGDKSLKTEPPKITKTEPPKVRVVHYTEFQPAVSPFPEAADQRRQERGSTQTDIKIETEKFPRESALSPRESALSEIKPPENLPVVSRAEPPPPVVSKVEPPIETKPIPVAAGAEPLDLRRAPVEAKSASETKPVSEKKAPTLAEGEVGVPTAKRVGEKEEMIDLSTFKKI